MRNHLVVVFLAAFVLEPGASRKILCEDLICERGEVCQIGPDGNAGCDCAPGYNLYWGTCMVDYDFGPCLYHYCPNGKYCDFDEFGNAVCICYEGYTENQSGECLSTGDQCEPNPCLNGGTCTSSDGPYTCQCPSGYKGTQCELISETDPCQPQPCENGGECVPKDGGFSCRCFEGYTGKRCNERVLLCEEKPCQNGGYCYNLVSDYYCSCVNLYKGKNCEIPPDEKKPDPCSPNPCKNGGVCSKELDGSYKCKCAYGFIGETCSQKDLNPCTSNPCLNGGLCVRVGLRYACDCVGRYTGRKCEIEPRVDDACRSNPCKNGGICITNEDSYLCDCATGFAGKNCDKVIKDKCSLKPCKNNGLCYRLGQSYFCSCKEGFSGTTCEIENRDPCSPDPCLNGGSCIKLGGNTACICIKGYKGKRCEIAPEKPKPCASNPCKNAAKCKDRGDSYLCYCTVGFRGTNCEIVVTPCDKNPCKNEGKCINKQDDYTCVCKASYTGKNCETVKPKPKPCASNPCKNGGACRNRGTESYICYCLFGFRGNNCETVSTPCDSSPCKNKGKCINKDKDYRCNCTASYTGRNCDTLIRFNVPTPCTKSCNGGTRFTVTPCAENNLSTCPRRFEDCSTDPCPKVNCPSKSYRYDSESACCEAATRNCGTTDRKQVGLRIIGGKLSNPGEWPWMAAMLLKSTNGFICGATVISDKWLITAAHCLRCCYKHEINILLGSLTREKPYPPGSQSLDVLEMIEHPDYRSPDNDLALIKVNGTIKFTSLVKPVCLPGGEVIEQDVTCYAAGWGAVASDRQSLTKGSKTLQHVGIRIIPLRACVEGYKNTRYENNIDDKDICAGILSGGKDTCAGDSGGPLMCQRKDSCEWFLAGVTSFGATHCGIGRIPAVYADIVQYESWINESMS